MFAFLFAFVCALLGHPQALAQKTEIGFGIGGSSYKGDLAPAPQVQSTKFGAHAFFKYNPVRHWSLRAGFTIADIGAADSLSRDPFLKARNFHFSGNLRELAAIAEYNFFNFRARNRRRSEKWCPFLFGGLAVVNYTVKNNYLDNNEKFNATKIVIPFGVGVKHYLHPSWNLTFEAGARKTFTDAIDGIVGSELDPKFRKVNSLNNDMYFYAGVSLSYVFYSVRCAEPFDD